MQIYPSSIPAIHAMNQLGCNRKPFVFIIDFEMEKILVTEDLSKEGPFLFDFNGFTNAEAVDVHQSPSLTITNPIPLESYASGFNLVKYHIHRGDSFLLNLSAATGISTPLTLEEIFHVTDAKYKVCLQNDFVCFSPEIFVKIQNGTISSYPMKGTIDADIPFAEDLILSDEKELAEHYTIVDLIRNDLSQVAKEVKVLQFRYIDHIRTSQKNLLQVSSKISGKLGDDYHEQIGDILFRLLPAGSISGAPKNKTVEVIQEAEGQKRGYYTGICGYFDGYNLDSGVMIRLIEQKGDQKYYRSGCGITSESVMEKEYQEMLDKIYLPQSAQDQSLDKTSSKDEFVDSIKHISPF